MNHYEIEASVMRAKNGNREELLNIMEQYKPFIFKTARTYNIKNYDLYDLVQIGYVTLINVVAKYKTGSNTFSTYAFNSISNAFRYAARQNSKYNGELSLNAPLDQEADSGAEFIDSLESQEKLEETLISRESVTELKRIISKLPADELEFIIMVYYNGASIKTYAEKKGLSYQQAMRKKIRVLDKLKKQHRKF
jgi:RNA polymerase sporulation-specific sigma factor